MLQRAVLGREVAQRQSDSATRLHGIFFNFSSILLMMNVFQSDSAIRLHGILFNFSSVLLTMNVFKSDSATRLHGILPVLGNNKTIDDSTEEGRQRGSLTLIVFIP